MQRKGEGSTARFDVVAVGEASIDIVAVAPGFPEPGTKLPLSELEAFPGGQAATAAVGCARLGWKTRLVTVLGRDAQGAQIESALEHEGVDVMAICRDGVPTRSAVILVDQSTGERTVLENRHAGLTLAESERPIDEALTGRILLVDAVDAGFSVALARAARQRHIPTILDVDRDGPGVTDLLAAVDVLVMPRALATQLTGQSSPAAAAGVLFRQFGAALAVVTLGPHGAVAQRGEVSVQSRPPAVEVVDTTGAGDAFRAGLAAAWLEIGPDAPLERLLAFANAVAALNCRAVGAQTALPARADLDQFL